MNGPPRKSEPFTTDTPALPMYYPGFIFRKLSEAGYATPDLLADTNLSPEFFSDPAFRTDFSTLRQFILNALRITGDPHLGPRLAMRFEPQYIGAPAYAALNAATLRDGLDVLARFVHLTFPAIDFVFSQGHEELAEDEAEVRIRPKLPLGDVAYFFVGSALTVLNRLLLDMLRAPIIAHRVETTIAEPEGWADVAPQISRVPLRFAARENRIIFPANLLQAPLPASDPINHARLVAICETFAEQCGFQTTVVRQVQEFLEAPETLGAPLSKAAAALGYSERGLRRQLERTGTSYRKLTDEVRERRARDMLLNTSRPIQAIAFELGFESASNFARSFKRWTGNSPTAYREMPAARKDDGQN